MLLPLWKLNPVEGGDINLIDDLPRDEYSVLRDINPKPVFIIAKYELSENEQKELSGLSSGAYKPEEFKEMMVKQDYDNHLYFEFPEEKLPNKNTVFDEIKHYLETADESLKEISEDND